MTATNMRNFNSSIMNIVKTIGGCNIAFVIDASDSLPGNLELIKALAIELINIFHCQIGDYSFNVISISDAYSKLSNIMLPCNQATVSLAIEWIQTLNCDTSKNTLLALGTAFTDNQVDTVIMLTDGLSNQKSPDVIRCLSELSQERPLHIIHVNEEEEEDKIVIQFLETLALSTKGTLHTIKHESKCVLKGEQIFPRHNDGVISSSNKISLHASSSDENSDSVEEKCDSEDNEDSLDGKVVIAKRSSNGYYYKGTVIKTVFDNDVIVLFDPSKGKTAQLQQSCSLNDILFYEEAKEKKIYCNDKVLVNLEEKRRYIPASVIRIDYILDDPVNEDDVHFQKILQVELFNGDSKSIPISSALHISVDCYDEIVDGILRKLEVDTNCHSASKKASSGKEKDEMKEVAKENSSVIAKDLLRDRIERQLRESEEYLHRINRKVKSEHVYNGKAYSPENTKTTYSDHNSTLSDEDMTYACNTSTSIPSRPVLRDDSSYATSILRGRYSPVQPKYAPLNLRPKKEKHCRFTVTDPHPPVSWNGSSKNMKRGNCTNPRTMRKCSSVGSNVVELSRKHWKGRPITKEASPKRPGKERYAFKPSPSVPTAEEYQTTSGVPFPRKTDNRFKGLSSCSWSPGVEVDQDYMLHDIIAHRVVNPNSPNEKIDTIESKEEKREKMKLAAMKTNRALREERESVANENKRNQLDKRDENVRKQIEERIQEELSKFRITLEKDEELKKSKQHKNELHRQFECEREDAKQEKKYTRIEALKDRRRNYESVEKKRSMEKDEKQKCVEKCRRSREEKESEFERQRIEREIENHESKLNRLKEIRKNTERKMQSVRKENDKNKDIDEHVRKQKHSNTLAGILP